MEDRLLTDVFVCPSCCGILRVETAATWQLGGREEPRTGLLRCSVCERAHPIVEGIVDLLVPTPVIEQELAANRKLLSARADCDDEWLLGLPGSHAVQRPLCADHDEEADLAVLMAQAGVGAGRLLLDLGAGTCWTTARWARLGFEAIAADISLEKFVGLHSAEAFLGNGYPYFNRMRFDMSARWPIRDESLDVVVGMASIHHAQDINTCFAEIRRVLRPDGLLLLVESTRSGLVPEQLSGFGRAEREEYGMNERSYSQRDFRAIARRAGLELRVIAPGSLEKKLELVATRSGFGGRTALKHRIAYLAAPLLRAGGLRRTLTGPAFVTLNWLFGMGFVGIARPTDGRGT